MQWLGQPLEFLDRCAERYGDTFSVDLGIVPPSIFTSDPEAIARLFAPDSHERFDSGRGNEVLSITLGRNSMIVADGERHQRQRKLLMPPFHGERMRAYGLLIRQIVEKVTTDWQAGKPVLVRTAMQKITLQVILQAVFGLHEGPRLRQLRNRLSWFLDSTGSPMTIGLSLLLPWDLGPLSPRGNLLAGLRQIDELIYAEIRERRTRGDRSGTDILTMMICARDEAGEPLTDVELRDQLMTLLVAGHETTASSLAWALYWVHRQPEIKEKLRAELDSAGNDPGEIAGLPYLSAVCSETLRLYPVALLAFPRIAREPIEVAGNHYAAGTILLPCIYLAHRRAEVYPEPERFRPERFLERQYSPYEYLPFGGGNRRCIGLAFALYEMKLILADLISGFELTLADDRPLKPVRRGVTAAPPGSLRISVSARRSGHALAPAR